MRLTCPNCDAQYEVPDDVVPTEGRDVQCSNCGQTWFQHHRDHPAQDDESAWEKDTSAPDEEVAPKPEAARDHGSADDDVADDDDYLDDDDEDADDAEVLTSIPAAAIRSDVDPAVKDILRQEAEAETNARRKRQSDPLESQPDLGLPNTEDGESNERRTLEARQRMARMRGEPEPMSEADVNAAAISSRRDLLPDIEEINSTLRTENDRATGADGQAQIDGPTVKKRKRSFRRGFLMMVVLVAILALVYAYAPRIAQAVPQLDPYLSSFVSWVDQMRLVLDGWVQSGLRWLDAKASQSGG
ncbi:MAG: zinc-ribbon domain-containing protein [Sulfitobacter sp.]